MGSPRAELDRFEVVNLVCGRHEQHRRVGNMMSRGGQSDAFYSEWQQVGLLEDLGGRLFGEGREPGGSDAVGTLHVVLQQRKGVIFLLLLKQFNNGELLLGDAGGPV